MAALTPEQMRVLAASFVHEADAEGLARQRTEFRAALRAAADQFEALEAFPHDCTCQWPHGDGRPEAYENYCSCWKSAIA